MVRAKKFHASRAQYGLTVCSAVPIGLPAGGAPAGSAGGRSPATHHWVYVGQHCDQCHNIPWWCGLRHDHPGSACLLADTSLEVKPQSDRAAVLRQLAAKLEQPHLPPRPKLWPGLLPPTITAQVPD